MNGIIWSIMVITMAVAMVIKRVDGIMLMIAMEQIID